MALGTPMVAVVRKGALRASFAGEFETVLDVRTEEEGRRIA
jgi:hypothetical protein